MNSKNYKKIDELTGGIEKFLKGKGYLKLKSNGYMDLTIEKVGKNTISMTHYYEQNGDLVPDPDIAIDIDVEQEIVTPKTFQNSVAYYDTESFNGELKDKFDRGLSKFLSDWLDNLKAQGFY